MYIFLLPYLFFLQKLYILNKSENSFLAPYVFQKKLIFPYISYFNTMTAIH